MNSSNHSGRSRKRSPVAPLLTLFSFWFFVFLVNCASVLTLLRKLVRLEEVLDESRGNDAEDELAPELGDTPGTTARTTFSVLGGLFFPFGVRCGF